MNHIVSEVLVTNLEMEEVVFRVLKYHTFLDYSTVNKNLMLHFSSSLGVKGKKSLMWMWPIKVVLVRHIKRKR